MSRLLVAALMLLTSIAGMLAAAGWNRGTFHAIVLTEREVALPWSWPTESGGGEPVVRLSFRWQPRADPQDAHLWLSEVKLRELGFGIGLPAGASGAEDFYGRSLPRTAWVAFEYDGPAWRRIEQQLMMGTQAADVDRQSRLVPIDAGLDAEALGRRHAAEPVVVLPAIIRMYFESHPTRGPSVWAMVDRLAVPDVTVPAHLRDRLRTLQGRRIAPDSSAGESPEPRYEVTLGVGRLGVAWVQDVRVLGD